jgi:hypothetical protein
LQKPKPLDVQTMYVQERTSEDKHPHYHYSVMTNARQIRKEHTIHEKAKHHWNNVLKDDYQDGLVNISNQNGPSSIIIDKNQPDFEVKKQQAFKQASYLAKDYSKEHNQKGSWKCGGNRIPKSKSQQKIQGTNVV